ncbi:ABC transporter substrate-binding protein [Phytoactinopolyspora mesophila]|uniref:ABC transporter substrate-binding protein n=1 Tax=Phytoactinopolyspora mesophila TaxID=2650750 RepID=A0A7K3M8Z8_9ACTN|nr:ABC transporter substrate-binding protein [Phytoactinopolyspora mesophila]NDL58888.1 ABC transporter substrate-binding protein [Phytoactinopolyspora mesophila]
MRMGPTIAVAGSAMLFRVACGPGGDDGSAESDEARNTTFTTSIPADPGDLHPHMTTLAATRGVAAYMYDKLVYFSMDGEQLPWLAESWEVEPDTVTYTIRAGVTCSDGSPLTASDVAANFEFIVDPDNGSPVRGVLVPAEMNISADDESRTVTLSIDEPDPFLFHSTGELFIACRAGLDDPDLLTAGGVGSGMYELTEAVPDDRYILRRRDEFSWGPGEISAADEGTVETITLRVIENESTAVNLFLSGELDAVTATGADRQRLEEEYEQVAARGTVGELFFNQADGRPGADPEVRAALAQALDYSELTAVITGGFGERSRAVAAIDPVACDYDAVDGNLPAADPAAADAALDAAGWELDASGVRAKDGQRLSIELVYNSTRGDTTASAAELIAQKWGDVGAGVTPRGMPPTEYNEVIFSTGAWDAALLPINVRLPSQLVPFFSGTVPPDGVNLAHLENDAYESAVAEAMTLPGEQSCELWRQAEQALFDAHDVLLFADETIPTFLQGVTLERGSDGIVAPTIRVVP